MCDERARHDSPHEPTAVAVWSDFCAVAPHPDAKARLKAELADVRKRAASPFAESLRLARTPRRLGFDDGVIIPPDQLPVGTPFSAISRTAADRAPLRGAVRVIVVLTQFTDRAMGQTAAHFNDLFFSTGVLPNGSVKEYYREVTGNLVDIVGEVVGPFTLPQTLAFYANNNFGIGKPSGEPRANQMARDAAVIANPQVNYGVYDNDGNGFVDAFIVVHAGQGGEQTLNPGDIWSHKWTLPSAFSADGKQIFAYLTIPEDARIGVCAHELGHLLFGFPDLYDTDDTSEGIGNWCLMAGGSWNGNGDTPAHPSAWCKAQQGWAAVTNVTTSGALSIPDVKSSKQIHRLWKDGAGGSEYFLVENRQRTGFDAKLPADGLLIWHIDENQAGNTDENHYKVALMQADGKRDMEADRNRGDAGDPYPGSSNNTTFNASSTPNSKSYAGQDTSVSVIVTSASGPTMTANVQVSAGKTAIKDSKDQKDRFKDTKETKEGKDTKEGKEQVKERKDLKDNTKERKDFIKEIRKDGKDGKEFSKERKDFKDRFETRFSPAGGGMSGGYGGGAPESEVMQMVAELEARVSALEAASGAGGAAQPFIGSELRPDLVGGPDYGTSGTASDLQQRMAAGDREAKRAFDTLPPG
jgi:immune inhibitor A